MLPIAHKTQASFAAGIVMLLGSGPVPAVTIEVVDGQGRPLANAVVTADVVPASAAANRAAPARVQQIDQQFAPRVSVVATGDRVSFPNQDTTQHHVYSFSEARQFEIELYHGHPSDPILFDTPGIVALGCNIHDWMLGYIFVTDDPLFGVSGDDGRVLLDGDAGVLTTLTVWHPAAREIAPRVIDPGAAEATADGHYRLVVDVEDPDPLHFERDPLQELFSETSR